MKRTALLLLLCSLLPSTTGKGGYAHESELVVPVAPLVQDPTASSHSPVSGPSEFRAAETLTDVLRAHGLPTDGQPLPNLEKAITSYGLFDDQNLFIIAYYLDNGSNLLSEPLVVDLYDRSLHRWKTASIGAQNAKTRSVTCLGSVMSVTVSEQNICLDTRLNPSAGCTLVLSRNLDLQAVLYGWYLAFFQNGAIVYHNSQVHFAPTHYAEISVYEPAGNRETKIYPMKPYQPIRASHIVKVRAAYSDEDWCRNRNHHCDPELFDNDLVGKVEVNDVTSALAFVVAFDNKDYWSETERARLEGFRELRKRLAQEPLYRGLSDLLFMDLYADIARIKRLDAQKKKVLELFEDDRELHELLTAASAAERGNGQSWRAFFDGVDSRWEQPAIWNRLAKKIAVPPEYTEVVYIYRHVFEPDKVEWKELLMSDFKEHFGDIPLKECLTTNLLNEIFKP